MKRTDLVNGKTVYVKVIRMGLSLGWQPRTIVAWSLDGGLSGGLLVHCKREDGWVEKYPIRQVKTSKPW